MTEQRKARLKRQLQEARCRLERLDSSFAAPLRDMLFVATKDVRRMSTNGSCIYFDPDWLQKLGETTLDFILSHQLMHAALGHIERPQYFKGELFHLACDIVANSHLELLGWKYESLPRLGKIFHETFFPKKEGRSLSPQEAIACIPFDPAEMKPAVRRSYILDSERWWDRKEDRGEHGVIVLSPADEDPEDLVGDGNNTGGDYAYRERKLKICKKPLLRRYDQRDGRTLGGTEQSMASILRTLRESRESNSDMGTEDAFRERVWQKAVRPGLDWRKLLDDFIQTDVCDYSFTPPDRRFQEGELFLPDYNVLTERPKEVLFMVDTSGSVDDEMLAVVYSEIANALSQFGGGLVGTLAFFDTRVYAPRRFTEVGELRKIIPHGGGGTNFHCVFDFIRENRMDDPPATVVIFTDGRGEYPQEPAMDNVPVLWLLSNKSASPPWGKYAYVGWTGV